MKNRDSSKRKQWTTEELATAVAALLKHGADQVARMLGVHPKTLRSALHRHGISVRQIRKALKYAPAAGHGVVARRSRAGTVASYGAAALSRLPDCGCRWPSGDPSEPDFSFCGAPVARLGQSYCADHKNRAFAGIGRDLQQDPFVRKILTA